MFELQSISIVINGNSYSEFIVLNILNADLDVIKPVIYISNSSNYLSFIIYYNSKYVL